MKKIMIKNPILVRFGMILVLALAISSIVSSFFLGSRMRQENVEMMEKTISVVEYTLDTDKPLQEQLQKVHASALDANVRVTIIAKDGTVLADSDLKNVDGMENHLDRQEVKEALEKGEGSSTRYSESLGQEMLYVAKLSEDGKAIIRMSIPYTGLFRYMIVVLPLLLVGMIVAFAVSVAVAARYSGYIRSDEIKRQMVQMERDRKIRQEFFSNASHELKTPLTSIRGYTELIRSHTIQDSAQIDTCLDCVLKESDHMTQLINDILTISKLETEEMQVTYSHIQVKKLLDSVVETLKPQIEAMHLNVYVNATEFTVFASLDHIKGIFYNLISNAIKYNKQNGRIDVVLKRNQKNMYFSVEDTGVGIAQEDQSRIFQRFYRVDKQRSKTIPGTGLGLSIVKHVVYYYQGKIHLTSKEDVGTKITVELPIIVKENPEN